MGSPPLKSSGATPPRDPSGKSPLSEKKVEKVGTSGDSDGKKKIGRRSSSQRPPSRSQSPSHRRGHCHRNAAKPRERVIERVI
jgi:hypothetical protein